MNNILLLFIGAILAITAIDTLGSISSRKLNFNYVFLAPLSLLTFGALGFISHNQEIPLFWCLLMAVAAGIYDATVGWMISLELKANCGKLSKDKLPSLKMRILNMVLTSVLFSFLGYILGS